MQLPARAAGAQTAARSRPRWPLVGHHRGWRQLFCASAPPRERLVCAGLLRSRCSLRSGGGPLRRAARRRQPPRTSFPSRGPHGAVSDNFGSYRTRPTDRHAQARPFGVDGTNIPYELFEGSRASPGPAVRTPRRRGRRLRLRAFALRISLARGHGPRRSESRPSASGSLRLDPCSTAASGRVPRHARGHGSAARRAIALASVRALEHESDVEANEFVVGDGRRFVAARWLREKGDRAGCGSRRSGFLGQRSASFWANSS